MLGVLPFAIIFGSAAVAAGLPPWATLAMSLIVFAGSAQFIAVSLISGGAALPVIWLTTWVVNLRHALYSATLQPTSREWPQHYRALLAFWLTDEAFVVIERRLQAQPDAPLLPYALGSAGSFYANWALWTATGAWLGQRFPDLADWGLDFAMLATFAAMLGPQLTRRTPFCVALVAGSTAWLAHGLPYQLGLVLAALSGVAAGVWLDQRRVSCR